MNSKKNTSSMSRGGGVRPVYEVIKPMSEWNEEESSDILLLYLPGFMKEQIKVSTEGVNTLRIQGERLVAGNKWNRFEEFFPIPDHCNIRGIHAKVQGGVLIITMPNKTPKQPKNDIHQQQQKPVIQEPVPNQEQDESKTKDNNLALRRAADESSNRVNNLNMPRLEQERGKAPEMSTTLKGSSSSGETRNPQKGIIANLDKEKDQTIKPQKDVIALDKEKDKTDGIIFRLPEQCKQAIKGLGNRRISEERQLLVNMGAAILVIVAFGAYIFSGKAKR